MAVDPNRFSHWFAVLQDLYRHELSDPTLALYQQKLQVLSTEQFERAASALFDEGGSRMPAPNAFIEKARELTPHPSHQPYLPQWEAGGQVISARLGEPVCETPGSGPQLIASILKQIDLRRSLERQQGKPANSLISLSEEVIRYRCWLKDPVLRQEAIAWAESQEDVEIVRDGSGEVIDLKEVKF